jgi:nicotinamidase-related amidase
MALNIDKRKTAFLSMHFLNDLVHEDGKFAISGTAAHVKQTNCLVNTKNVLDECRRVNVPVIHVEIGLTEAVRKLLADLPVGPLFSGIVETGAFAEGTWGAEIHEEVKPHEEEIIVIGRAPNSFYATNLDPILRGLNIRTIVLSGVATNMVVESTARYACDALYEVIILRDCCASFNEEMHSFTLDNVLPNLATISNSEDFVNALSQ